MEELQPKEQRCPLGAEQLAALAQNFDHHGSGYRNHTTQLLDHMRETCPFQHTDAYGGFYVATRADTVLEIARNVDAFSNFPAEVIPALEPTMMIPIHNDPPELYDYRAILNPLFAPKKMKAEADRIRADAHRLIDALVAKGGGDVIDDFAAPLAGITTLRLLGISPDDWFHYANPMHELVYSKRPLPDRLADMKVMVDRMRDEIRKQLDEPVPGSVIDYLHNVDMAGRKLRIDEVDSMVLIMIGGGLDTAQALVGMISVYLARNPDRRQELIDHPERMEAAVEEFLRVFPPTQGNSRRATKDVTVAGQLVKAEEQVFMSYTAANRDPREFPNPEKIDFQRDNNRHFSFGVGPHRCLGSHLARLEVVAMLEALLAKAPDYKLVEDEVHLADDIGTVAGYYHVPITV